MSTTEKKVILDVQIRTADSVKRLAEIKKEQEALKKSNKELGKSYDENAEQIVLNEARVRELGTEQRRLQGIIDLTTAANKANEGSYDQLTKRQQLAEINLKKLEGTLRRNEDGTYELTEAYKKAADEVEKAKAAVIAFDQGVKNGKTNVGLYSSSVIDAVKSLNVFGISVGETSDQLASGAKNTGSFLKGIFSIKGGLTALVAVPIVAFLVGVVALLKKTQAGQEFLQKSFAAGGAVIDVLISKVIGFTTAVVEAFSKPSDLVAGFVTMLKDLGEKQIANFLAGIQGIGTAFRKLFAGEFAAAAKEAGTALFKLLPGSAAAEAAFNATMEAGKELGNELFAAGKKAFDLEARLIAVGRQNKQLEISIARLNAEFEQQSTIADDATRSFAVREAAAEKARKAAAESARLQTLIARNELSIANEQLAAKKKLGLVDQELKDKQREASMKLLEVESAYQKTLLDNQKQRSELVQDRLEKDLDILIDGFDNQKTVNEAILQDERRTFAERRALLEETRDLGTESFQKQIETIQKFTGKAIDENELLAASDAQVLNEKIRALGLSEIIEGRLLEVVRERRLAVQDLVDAEKDLNDGESEQYLESLDKQREALAGFFETRKEQIESSVQAGRVAENDARNQQLADDLIYLQSKLQLNRTFQEEIASSTILSEKQKQEAMKELLAEELALQQSNADQELAIARKNAQDQNAIIEAKYITAKSFTEGVGQLFELLAGSQEDAAEIQKVFTLGQIGIDTAKAISALTAGATQVAAAVAASSGPAGVATGPLAYAAYYGTQIVTILANIAKAKQLLQFYDGGMVGYTGDGAAREESLALGAKPYTYHRRELIVPDRVLRTPEGRHHGGALLAMMRATMPEHRVKGFANGGFGPAAASVAATVGVQRTEQEATDDLAEKLLAGIRQLPPQVLQVSELERVENRRKTKISGGLR